MKSWPIIPLLLLSKAGVLAAQDAEALDRKGQEALADGLHEIAEAHFRQCLEQDGISPEQKSKVTLHLAEALVRSGNPAGALDLLSQSSVSKDPAAPFWRAQALVAQKRFSEAIPLFTAILADSGAPFRQETAFTKASLELALGSPEDALQTLTAVSSKEDPETTARLRLYETEILLDLGRVGLARETFGKPDKSTLPTNPNSAFLEARLLLAEGKADEAEEGFQELVNHPQGQTLSRYHSAAVGLADAIAAQGDSATATTTLLEFLQSHPGSPLLPAIFGRLLDWLPDKPLATDPLLERLAQWITPTAIPSLGPIASPDTSAAVSAWPVHTPSTETTELLAWSLYARALGLHRIGTPEAMSRATGLFNRLRVEFPAHPLASRALYQEARWLLEAGNAQLASSIFDTLRETASPRLRGEAAFLEGRSAIQEKEYMEAAKLFDEASNTLDGEQARESQLQAAIARIRSGVPGGVVLVQQTGTVPDKALEADVELERALAAAPPSAARAAIEEFLTHHPEHPRAPEARLAAAEAGLAGPPPDLSFARAQLDTLATTPDRLAALPPARVAMIRLRIADLSHDSPAAIAAARSIIETFPDTPAALEAALTLGRNLFQSGDYNSARRVLEKLARDTVAEPARSQPAWLLAARAAALGGTPSSKEEALILFDEAIKVEGGPVTSVAILEKARHLIDMYRFKDASAFLDKWIRKWPAEDPLQLPAGLLLGEALYAQGSTSNPASLEQALTVYDRLLSHAKKHPALFNLLQFLRGNALKNLPDPKKPSSTREKEAFQAYYSVLETDTPPAEWEYFEECGFQALSLLEKEGRARAAIAVAKKIASFKGPRSEEANARASKIQLEQQVWEEE